MLNLAISLNKSSCIVEVGSYLGASSCFLAVGAKLKKGHVYCVDTWHNEGMSEGLRDTYEEFLHNIQPLRKLITPLRGQSVDIARTFDKEIDLLFIDSAHSYEGCSSDVKAWMPHLKSGAMIVFHDYGWAEGVRKTVLEFIKPIEKKPGEVLENTYWTIV